MLSAALLSASIILLPVAQASAAACFTVKEADAARLRILFQVIDVASMNCKGAGFEDLAANRDRFVSQQHGMLRQNAGSLGVHFRRAGGKRALDRWMTDVANNASMRAAVERSYCEDTFALLRKAQPLSGSKLISYASELNMQSDMVPVCGGKKTIVRTKAVVTHHVIKHPPIKHVKPVKHTQKKLEAVKLDTK